MTPALNDDGFVFSPFDAEKLSGLSDNQVLAMNNLCFDLKNVYSQSHLNANELNTSKRDFQGLNVSLQFTRFSQSISVELNWSRTSSYVTKAPAIAKSNFLVTKKKSFPDRALVSPLIWSKNLWTSSHQPWVGRVRKTSKGYLSCRWICDAIKIVVVALPARKISEYQKYNLLMKNGSELEGNWDN